MGDPAGIGPEIVLKALAHPKVFEICRPVVLGDARALRRAAPWVGSSLSFNAVTAPGDGRFAPGTLDLLDLANADPTQIPIGKVSAPAGRAAVEYVFRGSDLATANEI